MSPARAGEVISVIAESAPAVYSQALGVACIATKSRPVFLMRQPPEKRNEAVRRALARVSANDMAEELLATYFLDCRKELLVEWLDLLGLEHEDGVLQSPSPGPPPAAELERAVTDFLERAPREDRELLLRAFAAQAAIDWPDLEAALSG